MEGRDFLHANDLAALLDGLKITKAHIVGLSLGGTTGYAINPARDFGPRMAHAVLPVAGKGGSDWGYAPIPILGPVIGGSLAGLALKLIGVA